MNTTHKTLSALTLLSLSAISLAQAPIVRQPPPPPPPDQQQTQPYEPPPPPPPADAQQSQQPAPPPMAPEQLDQLVQRIALYPDPLLAQILTASTFPDQIPDADVWAQQHSNLFGDALSQAIQADNLPWDPSVLALLPFPSLLDTMARDSQWTGSLGSSVLSQRADVMDAVQRQRRAAHDYGYLTSGPYSNVVDTGGYIEIQPVNPAYYYVPVYNPAVVFYAPHRGFGVGTAIRFGPAITIGPAFGAFGWYGAGFGWGGHTILIDHRPWGRTYSNRTVYVHPYQHPYVHPASPRVETHEHHDPHDSHLHH